MTDANRHTWGDGISTRAENMDTHASLTFHFVFLLSSEWRRIAVTSLERVLAKASADISSGYGLTFLDIRLEGKQAHFLVSCGSPVYSPKQIATLIQVMTDKVAVSLPAERRAGYWNRSMWEPGFSVETLHSDTTVL